MENIIRDSIVEHLSRHKLIRSTQHGFVNGRSTQSNLLEYMEQLTKLVDEGHSVDVVYCDFSKGFDCWLSVMAWVSEEECLGGWRNG